MAKQVATKFIKKLVSGRVKPTGGKITRALKLTKRNTAENRSAIAKKINKARKEVRSGEGMGLVQLSRLGGKGKNKSKQIAHTVEEAAYGSEIYKKLGHGGPVNFSVWVGKKGKPKIAHLDKELVKKGKKQVTLQINQAKDLVNKRASTQALRKDKKIAIQKKRATGADKYGTTPEERKKGRAAARLKKLRDATAKKREAAKNIGKRKIAIYKGVEGFWVTRNGRKNFIPLKGSK